MAERKGPIYWLREKSIEVGRVTQKWSLRAALITGGVLLAGVTVPLLSDAFLFSAGWYAGDKVQDKFVDPSGNIQKEVYAKHGEKPGLLQDLKRASGIGHLRFWGK